MRYGLPSLPVECPHCGKPLVYGLWDHVTRCAKQRQRSLDREWEERQRKRKHGGTGRPR